MGQVGLLSRYHSRHFEWSHRKIMFFVDIEIRSKQEVKILFLLAVNGKPKIRILILLDYGQFVMLSTGLNCVGIFPLTFWFQNWYPSVYLMLLGFVYALNIM